MNIRLHLALVTMLALATPAIQAESATATVAVPAPAQIIQVHVIEKKSSWGYIRCAIGGGVIGWLVVNKPFYGAAAGIVTKLIFL
ncbi:MAG TPA: hypothetical protein VLG71_02135 [Candidatus Limnocylindria bacterium]|nr:hypothetical protein [Candidatus Limnocylindria bacterium]